MAKQLRLLVVTIISGNSDNVRDQNPLFCLFGVDGVAFRRQTIFMLHGWPENQGLFYCKGKHDWRGGRERFGMRMLREMLHGLWTLGAIIGAGLKEVVTIMAFTEGGRMLQLSLSRRAVALSCVVFVGLTVGSTITLFNLARNQYYLTHMQYLEREKHAMTSLLQRQAEQLSKLQLEMAKLKELEESLRQVAGLSVATALHASEPDPASGRGSSRDRQP